MIDLDTASRDQLLELRNVGPVSADRIIESRPITSWEILHQCAPKLIKRDVLLWHQIGTVTSSIPEFQHLAVKGSTQIACDLFDPLGKKEPGAQPKANPTITPKPGEYRAPPSYGLLPSEDWTMPSSNMHHPSTNPMPGEYRAPLSQFGACAQYDPNSFDIFMYDTDDEDSFSLRKAQAKSKMGEYSSQKPHHLGESYLGGVKSERDRGTHQYNCPNPVSDNSINDAKLRQEEDILEIVRDFSRMGETIVQINRDGLGRICDQTSVGLLRLQKGQEEWTKMQEMMLENQQAFFRRLEEDRRRTEALYREQMQQREAQLEEDRKRQESFFKSLVSQVATITVPPSAPDISSQLQALVQEVRSVVTQQKPLTKPPEQTKEPANTSHKESTNTLYDSIQQVYPPDNIFGGTDTANEGRHWASQQSLVTASSPHPTIRVNRNNANQANNQRKLQTNLIENFEGDAQLWEGWKKNFLFVANACNWNDDERLLMLRTHLRKTAMNAVQNLPDATLADYNAILTVLDLRYGAGRESTKTRLRAELNTVKQLENEDIEAFADRVYALTVHAHPTDIRDEHLQRYAVDAFIQGCRDKTSSFLASLQHPATIRDAVDQVRMVQVQGSKTGSKLVARQVSFEPEPVTLEVRQASTSPSRCFECNGTGHKASECANKRRRSPSPFRCYECNGEGHIAAECANRLRRSGDSRRHASPDRNTGQERGRDRYRRYTSPNRDHNRHSGDRDGRSSSDDRQRRHYDDRRSPDRRREDRPNSPYRSPSRGTDSTKHPAGESHHSKENSSQDKSSSKHLNSRR